MRATRDLIESQISRFLKLCSKWTLTVQSFQIAEYIGTDKEESLKLFNEALNIIEQDYQNETIELKYGDTNSNGSFKRVQTAQFIIDSKDNISNVNIFNPQQQANKQIFSLAGFENTGQNNIQVLQGLVEAGIGRAKEEMRAESAKQIAEMQAQFILKSAELEAKSIIENAKRESERILAEALKREEDLDKREEEFEEKLEDFEEKQDEYKQATKAGLSGLFELVKDKIGITPLKGLKKETTEEIIDEEIEEKNTTKKNSSFDDDIEMEVINKEETKQPAQEQPKKVDLDFVLNNLTKEEAELLGLSLAEKFPDLAIEPE